MLIEFKRPLRDEYEEEDPVTQVYRLVREIKAGKIKDANGRLMRPASSDIPAYCYVIADLTEALEIRLKNMGATRTPDNLGYYGFNPTLDAYYEVISYSEVLTDARNGIECYSTSSDFRSLECSRTCMHIEGAW